uniref:Uncharacterized protein n=1 Tax=Cucumis melo TaxID=3656 RepID=A0A9I9E3E4_CUCME
RRRFSLCSHSTTAGREKHDENRRTVCSSAQDEEGERESIGNRWRPRRNPLRCSWTETEKKADDYHTEGDGEEVRWWRTR